jgi:hypothetical protein
MGKNISPPEPYQIYSFAGFLSNSVVSEFEILNYPAGLNIKLDSITKTKSLYTGSVEANDQIKDALGKGKTIQNAIKIVYYEYEVDIPGPRPVTERNEIYWDGTPVQVIVEVIGGGGTSTVTDVAL